MSSETLRLSRSQHEAVHAPWKGRMYMVLSTAGSGKTYVLSMRAVRIAKSLLDDERVRNKRILCICFNQSMADEMHHRISHLVQTFHLSRDVSVTRTSYSMSNGVTIEVRTFHALGRYLLNCASQPDRDTVAVPSGFLNVLHGRQLAKLYFEALKHAGFLQSHATEKSSKHRVYELMSYFDDFKGKRFDKFCEKFLLSSSKQNLSIDENIQIKDFRNEYEVYQSLLYDRGVIDYGDMLMKSIRLLLSSSKVRNFLRNRYVSVLVDEFQDVSASQLLMCKIAVQVSKSLTLVGDDDQQIYSWRTSPDWYCHVIAKNVFPSIHTLVLPENRRCPATVVRAASALISSNQGRAPKDIVPTRHDGLPVQVVGCNSVNLEMQFVLNCVRRLMEKQRHHRFKKEKEGILVLFRTNDILAQFQNYFKDAGVHTTRELHPNKITRAVGSLTLATLALVTIVTADIDIDSFVWAASTIASGVQEYYVHRVLADQERAENIAEKSLKNSRNSSLNSSNTSRISGNKTHGKNLTNSTPRKRRRRQRSLTSLDSSVYLERLKTHLNEKSKRKSIVHRVDTAEEDIEEEDDDDPRDTALFDIVKISDELLLETRKLHNVEQIVKKATNSLTSSAQVGADESVPEPYSDDYYHSSRGNSNRKPEYEGYDVLLTAARKVDTRSKNKERRERERNPPRRVRVEKVQDVIDENKINGNGDDGESDLEDFSVLFSSDVKKTKKKHRKAQGIISGKRLNFHDEQDDDDAGEYNEESTEQRNVTNINDDMTEFCNVVRRSLGDYTSGLLNKASSSSSSSLKKIDQNESCPVFSSIHSAKGSTFHHVFLCGVNKYNLPTGQLVSGIGTGVMDAVANVDPSGAHCREERRVFFVAQTRAVTRFVCTYASEAPNRNNPKEFESMFITEMIKGVSGGETTDVVESFVVQNEDVDNVTNTIIP